MKKTLLWMLLVLVVAACNPQPVGPDVPGGDPDIENPGDEPDGPGEEREDEPKDEPDDPSGTGKDDPVDPVDDEGKLDESEFTKSIDLVWNGSSVTVSKNDSGLAVSQDGGHVVIGAPGAAGKKVRVNLSGRSTDGSLKIYNGVKSDDTNKKMLLSFNGLELSSSKGPAINIQSGKTVYVLLSGTNSLVDAAVYSGVPADEDAKGAFFSEKQLVFSGSGTLTVEGKSKHAIAVDDYVVVHGGNIIVKNAAADGIHTNQYVSVEGGSLQITSVGEGIQCEEPETGYFNMAGGTVEIKTTGQKSGGVEAALDILVSGGKLNVTTSGAASKCLKSANNVAISGGTLTLNANGAGMYDSTDREAVAAACIKAENNVILKGGDITCKATGSGGKGINCYKFECSSPTVLDITTTGSTYTYSSSQTCRPKAVKATNGVVVNGGSINILTTGTEGEGLESKTFVEINGGAVIIQAKDDGINAATTVTFNGGYTYAYSTSNDGIDSNYGRAGSIVVDGGVVISHAAGGAEEGFDADSHANLTFKSGFAFCTGGQQGGGGGGGRPGGPGGGWPGGGGSGSGSNPSCGQPTYMWNKAASANTYFHLTDASGNVVMSCFIPRSLNTNYSIVSAPMTTGATYKYGTSSSAPAGATEVFGKYFYSSGTVSGLTSSFTAGSGYVGNL